MSPPLNVAERCCKEILRSANENPISKKNNIRNVEAKQTLLQKSQYTSEQLFLPLR